VFFEAKALPSLDDAAEALDADAVAELSEPVALKLTID
jgi:uncharacterized protein YbjQ (UPF0145 family)